MQTHPSVPRGPLRALLVEGSAVACGILERVLNSALVQAVDVTVVTTPDEAPPDLEGLDLALVDIDRDDAPALGLLARLPRRCWRLATTLYDEEDRLLPALETGVHGYLLKQDRYERLVEGLQRVLRGRPEMSPALARSVLESLRQSGQLEPRTEQTLASLGRGRSVRETARALKISAEEVESAQARVFRLVQQARPLSRA